MRLVDVDFREMLNTWPDDDIRYLIDICNEKLSQSPFRRQGT